MWTHALLTLYRSLTRHRLYAALNILGLAVGIAVFIVLSLYVSFETSFERWIPEARSIYAIRTSWNFPGHALEAANVTMAGLLDEMKEDYPQLIGTRIWDQSATVRQGAQLTSESVEVVDPSFFKIFDLPLAAGDKATLLQKPDDLILTETKAKRYFGAANPIGQRLTVSFQGKVHDYRVVGVLKDLPKSTDFQFDFLVPLTPQMVVDDGPAWRHWGSVQLATYFKFDTPAAATAVDTEFDRFVDRHAGSGMGKEPHKTLKLRTQALLSTHLLDPKDETVVATLGTVGLLTLLLACVNYVNLATARAGLRAREVALRKVMGATGVRLVAQFMGEAFATACLSALIGLALCELTLPWINAAGGLSLKMDYLSAGGVLPLIFGIIVVVGFGAGIYPALVLSRFEPAGVLASARTPGGGRTGARVREVLVVLQFAVAIAFTIATAVIVSQSRYLRHADIGFKRDGLIIVNSFDDSEVTGAQRQSLLALWRTMPGAVSATMSDIAPGNDDNTSAAGFKRPGVKGDGSPLNWVKTGPDFMQTYEGRVLAGRALDRAHGQDDTAKKASTADAPSSAFTDLPSEPRNAMVNANALKILGFDKPQAAIGQTLLQGEENHGFKTYVIVGVIDNIRFRSPRTPVPETIYFLSTDDFRNPIAAVRYANVDPRLVQDRMQATWRQIAPSVPFRARTIENNLQPYYKSDDERSRLFTIGAILAVAIGCVGLYGMASFNTARRVKEIGIRKTLGASTSDILRLLIGQFLRPVLIANLIAWPLAYLTMQNWLSGFDQRIGLNPLYFIAATLLTLVIAVGTVAGQAFAVARAEPAKALRHE